ncbi:hypothetical protein JCGZ_24818 [Jatropha curcas]|uniref:Neprosin PEP catalytic domain-containing protein n=1 Tax=Jatropha curcas TaxID=180498 RepID=A0A067L9P7_JATCU|nr:hypothetical protein JCGZ_24818 [Jatropha curcas]
MTEGNHVIKIRSYIYVFVALSYIFNGGDAMIKATMKDMEMAKHTGTVKTIKVEDGDVIDCVDIYKQPAFSHPLLKNHKIQLKPSSYPGGIMTSNNSVLFQEWNKKGKCPKGTIPIHAQVSADGGNFLGAQARLNVWNPATFGTEVSSAQIWVVAGRDQGLNFIQAGWKVNKGEKDTRFYSYWTRDNYQSTGCYNLDCPGFVQTNHRIAFGAAIEPISKYDGPQYSIDITIHKDMKSGNWWLQVHGQEVGYWPPSILTSLANRSTLINWGGLVVNFQYHGRHTSTQMGSGLFPGEGFGKASAFWGLGYIDNLGKMRDPEHLMPYVTKPSCYDLKVGKKNKDFGVHFYYGGPGFSPRCL